MKIMSKSAIGGVMWRSVKIVSANGNESNQCVSALATGEINAIMAKLQLFSVAAWRMAPVQMRGAKPKISGISASVSRHGAGVANASISATFGWHKPTNISVASMAGEKQ